MAKKPPIAERRFRPLTEVEFRGDGDQPVVRFRGHAAVFGEVTEIAGVFRERVDPLAFKKTLDDGADVRFLINHDPNRLGARTKSGTLRLAPDRVGLGVDADLDRRQTYINDLQIAMERKDLDQMSFAFRALQQEWDEEPEDGGLPIRTIKEAQLFDVSPVTFPAYESTDAELVSVRALAEADPRVKELLEAKTAEGEKETESPDSPDSDDKVSPDEAREESASTQAAASDKPEPPEALHLAEEAGLRRQLQLVTWEKRLREEK